MCGVHFCAAVDGYIWRLSMIRSTRKGTACTLQGHAEKRRKWNCRRTSLGKKGNRYRCFSSIILLRSELFWIWYSYLVSAVHRIDVVASMYAQPSVIQIVAWNAGMANPKLMIGKITNQPIRAREAVGKTHTNSFALAFSLHRQRGAATAIVAILQSSTFIILHALHY